MRTYQLTNELFSNEKTGYSVDINGNMPFEGYMVGGEVESLILDPGHPMPYLTTDKWLSDHYDLLRKPGYYAGIWTDEKTGKVYIDISRNVADLYSALAIASSRGEIAIWDVAHGQEVRTEETGAVLADRL